VQTFEPGTDISLVVPFLVDGEPAIPLAGSVTWTLRNNAGVPIAGYIDKAETTGSTDTDVTLEIDGADTGIGANRFEQRTIQVKATIAGRPWSTTLALRLAPFLNTTASPDAVRAYIGVQQHELPDSDIDIFAAFMNAETALTAATLTAALASGTSHQLNANKAITAYAVIAALPSLGQRILQKQTDGSIAAQRNKLDLAALAARAGADIAAALDDILDRGITPYPAFFIPVGVDVITGI